MIGISGWGEGSYKKGGILRKRGGKRSFYTVCSQSCVVLGGKLADVGKRYSKDISRGDKGRTFFFQRGGQSGMNSLLAPGLQPFSPHFSTQKSGKPEIFSVICEENDSVR